MGWGDELDATKMPSRLARRLSRVCIDPLLRPIHLARPEAELPLNPVGCQTRAGTTVRSNSLRVNAVRFSSDVFTPNEFIPIKIPFIRAVSHLDRRLSLNESPGKLQTRR